MSINPIYGNDSSMSLYMLYGMMSVNSATQSGTTTRTAGAAGLTSTDSINLSKPAELLSKLEQLKQSDPDKFKEVLTNIADELNNAAKQKSGFIAQILTSLADKFQSVANGGDISQLMPPNPPNSDLYTQQSGNSADQSQKGKGSHHGRHGRGAGNDIRQVMSNVLDELNKAVAS